MGNSVGIQFGNPIRKVQSSRHKSVVLEYKVGSFRVQILEGPTDNPIRILSDSMAHAYTFWIEGVGWNILVGLHPENRGTGFKDDFATYNAMMHLVCLAKDHPDIMDCTVISGWVSAESATGMPSKGEVWVSGE